MVAKKSEGLGTVTERRAEIDGHGDDLSIARQCELLNINRSTLYYRPRGESDFNLKLMRCMDEIYLDHPAVGTGMMTDILRLEGHHVNYKRIGRLMRLMGIKSLALGSHTSRPGKGKQHSVYGYLLRGRKITAPNQVWAADITYIPMKQGFMYLVGSHGLVEPLCVELEPWQYNGRWFLS